VCLVPVYLSFEDCSIAKYYCGEAFHLSPPTPAKLALQTPKDADATPDGDRLCIYDRRDDFKLHWESDQKHCAVKRA
jgi:hypothetical protein